MGDSTLDTYPTTKFLDKVFSSFNAQLAVKERERAAELLDQRKRELTHAGERYNEAVQSYTAITEMINAWERWSGQSVSPEPENGQREGTGGRAAIRKLLSEHPPDREWTIPEVAEALGLSKQQHHAIQVHLSRMARDNELVRPRKGVYRLPPTELGSGEERGGDPGTSPAMGAG